MDETKKALLSIDIDTAALTQNVTNAKTAVAALTDQLKELKAAGKDSGEAFDKVAEGLKKAGDAADKSAKALKDFSKASSDSAKGAASQQSNLDDAMLKTLRIISDLDKKYSSSQGVNKQQLEIDDLRDAYLKLTVEERNNEAIGGQLEKRITTLLAAQKNQTAEYYNTHAVLKNGTDIIKKHQGAIDDAVYSADKSQQVIEKLTKEYLELTESQKNNAEIGGVLKNQIAILEANVKNLAIPTIEDYTKKTTAAASATLPFGDSVKDASEKFDGLKEGFKKISESFTVYKKEVTDALNNSQSFNNSSNFFAKTFEVLKTGTQVATGGFKGLSNAIAGSGIGLLIVVLAAAIEHFKKFTPLVQFCDRVTAGLNGAFQAMGNIVGKLLTPMMKLFTDPKQAMSDLFDFLGQNLLNRLKSFGVILDGILHADFKKITNGFIQLGTGVTNATDKINGFVSNIKKAGTDMAKLTGDQQKLDDEIQASAVKHAENEAKIAKLKVDMLKASATERKRVQKEIDKIGDDETKEHRTQVEEQIRINVGKVAAVHGLTKKEVDDIKILGEVQIQRLIKNKSLNDEEVKSLRDSLQQQAQLNKASSEKTLKEKTEAAGKLKEANSKNNQDLDAIQASKNRMALSAIKNQHEKELAELKFSYEEQQKQYKGHTKVLAQLKKEYDDQVKKANDKHAKEDADKKTADEQAVFDARQQTKIMEAKDDYEKIYALKKEQDKEDQKFELSNTELTEAQKLLIIEKYNQKKIQLDAEHDADMHAAKEKSLREKLDKSKETDDNEQDPVKKKETQKKLLEDQYNLDVFLAAGNKDQLLKIDADYHAKVDALQKKTDSAKKKSAQDEIDIIQQQQKAYSAHFTKLAGLFGKNTQMGKAALAAQKGMAVAEIAINTEKQVSSIITATRAAVADDMEIPFIGQIKAAIDIAIGAAEVVGTIANGVKQTATLNSINPTGFARGGLYLSDGNGTYVTGPGTGTSDSINAKLSHGEAVINARSTEMFAPILSAINQAGGGRAFNTSNTGNGYALGGLFNGSNTLNDGSSDLANTRALNDMAKTLAANMPRQILVVEDVQAGLQNKAMLQSMSNF